jgi:hypothetical protein
MLSETRFIEGLVSALLRIGAPHGDQQILGLGSPVSDPDVGP